MKVIRCFYPKFFSLLFLLYFLGGTATLINASQEKLKNPKVLVVNSYHPGYKWSDDIMLGIRDAFVTQRNVELIIEHLDTKRHFDKPYLQQIEELFRRKYRSTNIDIIITSDDNALDFIIGIRKELFPNTPLIFCGIDHIKPERIAGQKPIYGIEEADSTASTIDLIISMHPDLESITFIADDTSTGNLMIEKTKKIKSSGQKNINFNYLTGMTLENLQSTLRKIPNKTVLFYLSFIRDKNGNIFSIENSMKLIANSANVPVYCSWGFRPGTGVLGGNILSGYKQGEISATIARRLLDRNSVEDIPAIQQAPLVYKFDYQAMIRFNIDDSSIPQNSLVFNKPSSFYSDNKKIIWITLFTIFLLILFIMFLFLNIGRRKKAETELQIAHDELGWKVEKRTTELSVSNKMLTKEIKERKSKEKALADSEEKHRSLIENLSDLIIILDKDGINVWNSPSVRQYGIEPEDAIGRPCDEYVHPDDLEEFRKLWDKVIANPGKIFIDEHRATGTPENPETWIYQYNTMVYLPEVPGINGVVAVCRNVTEQKLAEEALRENEKYLQQAQKIESIGTLAGGIAHDFNNVLQSIIGYTELTKEDVPEGSLAQSNLHEVFKSALRAKDMVQQILAFSRKADTKKKPIKVQSVVTEVVKFLRASIPTTIVIHQDIDTDCRPVLADSTQIHQVIMNLATNAYQAMQDKGGLLELTLMEEEINSDDSVQGLDPGAYLKLTISDTGHGINSVVKGKIFEPYFTTKDVGKGTGMGLSVVHGIVKDHGGDITVYSEPGKGTKFQVYLPLIEAKPVEPKTMLSGLTQTGTEHILLVDDEESIVFMTQQVLERLGYQVTSRTSSVEALEAFKARPDQYDLVITDMTMPNMTGKELAPRLKEIRPDIPIIICTGFSEMLDEDKAIAIGIQGFVMKPIIKDEIAGTIRKVFDKRQEK